MPNTLPRRMLDFMRWSLRRLEDCNRAGSVAEVVSGTNLAVNNPQQDGILPHKQLFCCQQAGAFQQCIRIRVASHECAIQLRRILTVASR